MKKTVQTVLLKKKKKFILMFTFAAILFLGFLCISAIYRDRGCKTETAVRSFFQKTQDTVPQHDSCGTFFLAKT